MAEQAKIASFLLEFSKALRAYNLYPSGHPALASQAFNLHRLLTESGGGVSFPVELELARSSFVLGGKPVSSIPVVSGLANHLYRRRLRKLTILSGITPEELHEFLQIISLSEDEIRTLGGIKRILEIRHVSTIGVVEVSYQEVVPDEEFIPPLELEEEIPLEFEESPPDEDERDKLEILFQEIQAEEDSKKLADLLADFLEVLRPLIDLERRGTALGALERLAQISSESGISREKRGLILKALKKLFSVRVLGSFLHWLAFPEGEEGTAIIHLFRGAGPALMPNLIGTLVGLSRGRLSKLPLPEILALYPEDELINFLIDRIRGGTSSGVNNSVLILGHLRNEKVIPILQELLARGDETLSWEVVSCFAKIGGSSATRILLNYYFSATVGLKSHILLTLGTIGGEEAFRFLTQVAQGDASMTFRKSAIEALGMLGDAKAVPLLSGVLTRRSWFPRKSVL